MANCVFRVALNIQIYLLGLFRHRVNTYSIVINTVDKVNVFINEKSRFSGNWLWYSGFEFCA
ncbi:hypothetical protein D3C72_1707390 [compost metagenome]